jgi:hypothetical protein
MGEAHGGTSVGGGIVGAGHTHTSPGRAVIPHSASSLRGSRVGGRVGVGCGVAVGVGAAIVANEAAIVESSAIDDVADVVAGGEAGSEVGVFHSRIIASPPKVISSTNSGVTNRPTHPRARSSRLGGIGRPSLSNLTTHRPAGTRGVKILVDAVSGEVATEVGSVPTGVTEKPVEIGGGAWGMGGTAAAKASASSQQPATAGSNTASLRGHVTLPHPSSAGGM